MSEKTVVATYVSPKSPKLTFHVGDKTYQLKNGALNVFSEDEEKAIDAAITTMLPRARQYIKKVSRGFGIKIVQEHREAVRKAAVSGPMGTGAIQTSASEVLQHQLDNDMSHRSVSPEAQEAAHEELGGMMVTSKQQQTVPAPEIVAGNTEVAIPALKQGISLLKSKTGD